MATKSIPLIFFLELVILKRKYNQLDAEFKDLKESKAAKIDAKVQV